MFRKIKELINSFGKSARTDEIEFLRSMRKLEIKDGDIVVLGCPGRLSAHQIERLKTEVEMFLKAEGFLVKIMVLDEGMGIGLLRKT